MESLVQSFEATDDQGNAYTLHVYQGQILTPTRGDSGAALPGWKRILTTDGRPVNRRGKGEYEIAGSRQILRSADPNAP